MPVGRTRVEIVDGQIELSGPSLFDEYLADPERTEAALTMRDGLRWYRTGDHGAVSDEGVLTVTGRLDDVIVSGGEKVSLGWWSAWCASDPASVEPSSSAPRTPLGRGARRRDDGRRADLPNCGGRSSSVRGGRPHPIASWWWPRCRSSRAASPIVAPSSARSGATGRTRIGPWRRRRLRRHDPADDPAGDRVDSPRGG